MRQNPTNHSIKEKYLFTSSMNEIFTKLLNENPEKYDFEMFDKVILNKK